jgi:hypothetical protein
MMGDERRAHADFDEDVDLMILEYLLHQTTKACLKDFRDKQGNEGLQPVQTVLTQICILDRESSPGAVGTMPDRLSSRS